MAADESLRTLLLAQSTITDIVGSAGVYLDDAGQADLTSYIVISQEGHDPHGNLSNSTGIGETQFDFDCYSKKRPVARDLADAVSAFFKDYSGTSSGTTFSAVNWIDEGSDKVTALDGSRVNYYVFTETFNVFWSE